MADRNGRDGGIVEQVNEEIAQVANALMAMGACEDCAIEAAIDVVMTTLAIEAPRVLRAYRDAIGRALTAAAN